MSTEVALMTNALAAIGKALAKGEKMCLKQRRMTMLFDGIEKQVIYPHCPCPDKITWVLIYEHKSSDKVQAQWAPVTEEAVKKVNELGLILECEILSTGQIALYCHYPDEEDYGCDIATNGPGERSPDTVLTKLILEKPMIQKLEEIK